MSVFFISDKETTYKQIETIKPHNATRIEDILSRIFSDLKVGFDYETNGLDPFVNFPLLLAVGNSLDQVVFDCSLSPSILNFYLDDYIEKSLVIGHHLKFDVKMAMVHHKFPFKDIWCTQVAEKSLRRNCGKSASNPHGLLFGLKHVTERRLKVVPDSMDKEVRTAFVGRSVHTNFREKEILYAASDVAVLPDIQEIQEKESHTYNLNWYITEVANPLVLAMSRCENEGFVFDDKSWIKHTKISERASFFYTKRLDMEVQRWAKANLSDEDRRYVIGGKYTNNRRDYGEVLQGNLFGEPTPLAAKLKKDLHSHNIKWNSAAQVVELFARLKLPLPTNDRDTPYAIPTYSINAKGELKVDKEDYSFKTGGVQLEQMLIDIPEYPAKQLINLLLVYKKLVHAVDSFGYNFLDKVNPVTNRIHSIYRTEGANTGRFQSGGGRLQKDKYNAQNIPRDAKYRHCFGVAEGYSVTTCDLSGAEVTIMCDKARDMQLYEWAVKNDDAHSPIAQACWRNVYLFRAGYKVGLWRNSKEFFAQKDSPDKIVFIETAGDESAVADLEKSRTLIINKKVNKPLRTQFKAVTFGTVYGMFAGKCAKTLGIPKLEGQVVIDTIKATIPKTFKMVQRNIKQATTAGYLVLDDRSFNTVWFPPVKFAERNGLELSFGEKRDIEGAARNYPIQGTQASMVKEAIVVIDRHIQKCNFDCALLSTVHDECVYRQPLYMDGTSQEWQDNPLHVRFTFDSKSIEEIKENFKFTLEKYKSHYIDDFLPRPNGEITLDVSFPLFVCLTMQTVANRYLKHFKMGSEFEVLPYWTK